MIFDWFNRKFIDRFLEFENNQFRCPVIDKPFDQSKQNNYQFSNGNEHRYRYFIPQVNSNANIIDSGIVIDDKQGNSNTKENETKTETTIFSRTSHSDSSKPELLSRIKKFYIVTSNHKIDDEALKLSAAFIKHIYSPNIRKFLVVPLPDNSLDTITSNSNSDDVRFYQPKLDDEKNCPSVCNRNEDTFKDLEEDFDDVFEKEDIEFKQKENLRDSLLKNQLEQNDDDGWRTFKKHQTSTLPTINSPVSKTDTHFSDIEFDDTKNLWRQSEIDGSWWCDLVDIELPVTCQSERPKLKQASEIQSKSALKSIFEKFFKSKTPENYDEMQLCNGIMD